MIRVPASGTWIADVEVEALLDSGPSVVVVDIDVTPASVVPLTFVCEEPADSIRVTEVASRCHNGMA